MSLLLIYTSELHEILQNITVIICYTIQLSTEIMTAPAGVYSFYLGLYSVIYFPDSDVVLISPAVELSQP